jgi:hypothetical protein
LGRFARRKAQTVQTARWICFAETYVQQQTAETAQTAESSGPSGAGRTGRFASGGGGFACRSKTVNANRTLVLDSIYGCSSCAPEGGDRGALPAIQPSVQRLLIQLGRQGHVSPASLQRRRQSCTVERAQFTAAAIWRLLHHGLEPKHLSNLANGQPRLRQSHSPSPRRKGAHGSGVNPLPLPRPASTGLSGRHGAEYVSGAQHSRLTRAMEMIRVRKTDSLPASLRRQWDH